MIICGLKLTHDGAVALIDQNELKFCIELEKLDNNDRYFALEDTRLIKTILNDHGYSLDMVNQFSIDGWGGYDQDALAIQPRLRIGKKYNLLKAKNDASGYYLPIAQYRELNLEDNVLEGFRFSGLKINGSVLNYESYLHVIGHILSSYCSSSFALANQSSYILIWDGGMFPRLYFLDPSVGQVQNLGPLFLLVGNIYSIFSQHFGPFKTREGFAKDDLSIAGKVMAYIAKGKIDESMFEYFSDIYENCYEKSMGFANIFANEFKRRTGGRDYRDEDVLHSLHAWVEKMLIEKLEKKVRRHGSMSKNLCIAGGCALNIKWNGAIRSRRYFTNVFVPPFPNDSGSALGAACAAMVHSGDGFVLRWNVYSGPAIDHNNPAENWSVDTCSLRELAVLLHKSLEPIVFLNGRAELGPRALGNRSILAAAISSKVKIALNKIKRREDYRPISPVCMEKHAPEIFTPGTPDPYMLFDHQVKADWKDRIPAVCHLDGTARLQTVTSDQNEPLYTLLAHYYKLSGIPLLCNTSANQHGKGFFPDVLSATKWGGTIYVWCEDKLYTRNAAK